MNMLRHNLKITFKNKHMKLSSSNMPLIHQNIETFIRHFILISQ